MRNITLVIMAAGIGSRFGTGIKQLEPIGPSGEIIMDYSIYDAIAAGFNKVVFVIRKDLEKDFKEVIGNRIEKIIQVEYAFQELDNIPTLFQNKFKNRTKPWGTGQAILACKEVINEPFLVINADDYYGKQAYVEGYKTLINLGNKKHNEVSMVGFELGNTLSENGGVTRGICNVNKEGYLTEIVETSNIVMHENMPSIEKEGERILLDSNKTVSMNMWALESTFINTLDQLFQEFLSSTSSDDLKKEFLLPTIIGDLLVANQLKVGVLKSSDHWFGVTYKEDKDNVVDSIQELIKKGEYPERLFG